MRAKLRKRVNETKNEETRKLMKNWKLEVKLGTFKLSSIGNILPIFESLDL